MGVSKFSSRSPKTGLSPMAAKFGFALGCVCLCSFAQAGPSQSRVQVFSWKATETVVFHAQRPKTLVSNEGGAKVTIRTPEFRGEKSYDFSLAVSPEAIRFRGSFLSLDTGKMQLESFPLTGEYTPDHEMVLDQSSIVDGKVRNQLLVCASEGIPGSSTSPFQDQLLLPPGILPFLCGMDFHDLYGLNWESSPNDPSKFHVSNVSSQGELLSRSFAHRWSADLALNALNRAPAHEEVDEYDKPSYRISALKYESHDGKSIPSEVQFDYILSSKVSERHVRFQLVGISEAKGKPLDVPAETTVLDYRLQGPHLTQEERGAVQPIIYAWTGELPPLSALHKENTPSSSKGFDWAALGSYTPPFALLLFGVGIVWRGRLKR